MCFAPLIGKYLLRSIYIGVVAVTRILNQKGEQVVRIVEVI